MASGRAVPLQELPVAGSFNHVRDSMKRIDDDEVLWIVVVKNAGTESQSTYIFTYTLETSNDMLKTLGRYATDPSLDFTWVDAARCSKSVRSTVREQQSIRTERDE